MSVASVLHRVSRGVFLTTMVVMPLFVLPWLAEPMEFPKSVVFVAGTMLSAVCFVIARLVERRPLTRPDATTAAFALFVLATAMSAAMSLAPAVSWMGLGSQEYASVLSVASFFVFFMLAKTFFAEARTALWMLVAAFLPAAVLGLLVLSAILGLNVGFASNLVGTPHVLAVYLLTMSMFGIGLSLVDEHVRDWFAVSPIGMIAAAVSVILTATIFVLLALDSTVLWALALVGVVSLFVIALSRADELAKPARFAPALIFFVLALAFLFLPTNFASSFPPEVSPNLRSTWAIANGAWNDGSVAWGTGPGTFAFSYAKYATTDINQTDFWDVVFDRGNAHVTTMLATHGVVGVLAWLFFVIVLLALAFRKISVADDGWRLTSAIFAGWIVIAVAAFVYTQNFALAFLFWLLSGLLASVVSPSGELPLLDKEGIKGRSEPLHRAGQRGSALLAMLAVVLITFATVTTFVMASRLTAEIAFAKALKQSRAAQTGEVMNEVVRLLDRAAVRNRWNDAYYRNLSQALVRRLSLLSSAEAADGEYVQSLLKAALAAANRATDVSPFSVLNWESRGAVHRDLLPVIPDAAQPAVNAYTRAVDLAPINPRIRVDLARTHLAIADAQAAFINSSDVSDDALAKHDDALSAAEEHLKTAIALKPDYAPAHYYLGLLYERQGKLAEAVRSMKAVSETYPNDVGVGLQLGLLYLRQGKNELAQAEFERILTIAPAYANAHWYLSVIYEQAGNLNAAIAEVEKVLETNPDSVPVKNRLDRLQKGIETVEIPEPVAPAL